MTTKISECLGTLSALFNSTEQKLDEALTENVRLHREIKELTAELERHKTLAKDLYERNNILCGLLFNLRFELNLLICSPLLEFIFNGKRVLSEQVDEIDNIYPGSL